MYIFSLHKDQKCVIAMAELLSYGCSQFYPSFLLDASLLPVVQPKEITQNMLSYHLYTYVNYELVSTEEENLLKQFSPHFIYFILVSQGNFLLFSAVGLVRLHDFQRNR